MSQTNDTRQIRIQSRVDSEQNWISNNPELLDREIGYTTDGKYKIGKVLEDGTLLRWNELEYASSVNLENGEGKNSLQQISNVALGNYDQAKGYQTQTGIKGYEVEEVTSGFGPKDTFKIILNENEQFGYEVGDILTFYDISRFIGLYSFDINYQEVKIIEIYTDNNNWFFKVSKPGYYFSETRGFICNFKKPNIGNFVRAMAASAEGHNTFAFGPVSHTEGYLTQAIGPLSHAEGENTCSIGINAHSEGSCTQAHGEQAHSEGLFTRALGRSSHAEGDDTSAGTYGVPCTLFINENNNIILSCENLQFTESDAEQENKFLLIVEDEDSYSSRKTNVILGYLQFSLVTGDENKIIINNPEIINNYSFESTFYIGSYFHFDLSTNLTGRAAHAEGYKTQSLADYTHSEGVETIANGWAQHVQGKYNIPDTTSAFIIGNGEGDEYDETTGELIQQNRSNAMTVDWKGNAWFAGKIQATPTTFFNATCTLSNNTDDYDNGKLGDTDLRLNYIDYGYHAEIELCGELLPSGSSFSNTGVYELEFNTSLPASAVKASLIHDLKADRHTSIKINGTAKLYGSGDYNLLEIVPCELLVYVPPDNPDHPYNCACYLDISKKTTSSGVKSMYINCQHHYFTSDIK